MHKLAIQQHVYDKFIRFKTSLNIAASMNAWRRSCLDSRALKMMRVEEYGQLIVNRIRWMMMMMMMIKC